MPDPALVVEDYSFWYQGEDDPALDGVSFEVQRGDFVLILGASGSGKSTLALNLVGVYPDFFGGRNEGAVKVAHREKGLVNRRELSAGERFETVNTVFQNPEDQVVTLTVGEEVAFALENYLVPSAEIPGRVERALGLVGLEGFDERSTHHLSGGEKQRLALASMLAMEPTVLILDEPTSNLDPAGTEEVLWAIARVREELGLTMLIVEHEVDEVFHQVDEVLLVDGRKVHGPYAPREFVDRHGLEVRDRMGLWIPQCVEVGLALRDRGLALPRTPLTGDELVEGVGRAPEAGGLAPPPPASTSEVPGETVIAVEGVEFSYPSTPGVLRGVDLEIRRGELLAIVGQNGSGKSTLSAHLNGLLAPSAGEVRVHGRATGDYRFAELARRVAYIFQVPEKQFIRNTVEEEIAHGVRTLGLEEDEVAERVDRLLETVQLAGRRGASPYVLSHGQKRRLSVACMVVADPDVVVLDEPTFGQDWRQAQNLMAFMRRLADSGAAVVFITHDMRLVAQYADRCAALVGGRKIFDGTPLELFAATAVLEQARLKAPPIHAFSKPLAGEHLLDPAELVQRIAEEGHARARAVL
jgi:energy-coupling factor transport system ATP-binding protein